VKGVSFKRVTCGNPYYVYPKYFPPSLMPVIYLNFCSPLSMMPSIKIMYFIVHKDLAVQICFLPSGTKKTVVMLIKMVN